MKKKILSVLIIFCSTISFAQKAVFEDGTKVQVNKLDVSYQSIRRFSAGVGGIVDGGAGAKAFWLSYLKPEKLYAVLNLGTAGIGAEGIIFFSGKTKPRTRYFNVKYDYNGYGIKVYVLKLPVEKRKEWGVYFNINDYGNILKETTNSKLDFYIINKQARIYAGIATVNYWHGHVNVEDDYTKRGQFIGRMVLAPFIAFGSKKGQSEYDDEEITKYGARLFYEFSHSFGFFGSQIKGRINSLFRVGLEAEKKEVGGFQTFTIMGIGINYNFL